MPAGSRSERIIARFHELRAEGLELGAAMGQARREVDDAVCYVRCDGCGEFRPSSEIVLGMVRAVTFRYCAGCDRIRAHHPEEIILAGRPA